jgi:hypothetical protein
MAMAWDDVVKSDDYQNLSAIDKFKARREYFDDVVAPQVPPDQHDAVLKEFYSDTNGKSFGSLDDIAMVADSAIRRAADSATFGFGDKIAAAGRAAFDSNLDYDTALAQERAATDTAGDILGKPGTIAADIAGGLLTGGGLAAKGVTLIPKAAGLAGNILGGAAEGALYGAASGVGHADAGFDMGTNLAAAGEGAAYGAGAGAAGGALASTLSPAMRMLFGRGADTSAYIPGSKLAKGAQGPSLPDIRMTPRVQSLAENAFAGGAAKNTLDRMAVMGDDAMVLNANRRMGGIAQGVASRLDTGTGPSGSDIVFKAVKGQRDELSHNVLDAKDQILGKPKRDTATIIEKAEEDIADTSPEYSKLLTGKSVQANVRKDIADTAVKEYDKWGSTHPVGTILSKFRNVKNLPADAVKLRNMKTVFNNLEKKYPEAKSSFYAVKKSIDGAIDKTTSGEYAKLQAVQANARTDIEAAKRAAGFLDGSTPARLVTADLTKATPARKALMQEVMLDQVDQALRAPGNDISNLNSFLGRHANASVRDNLTAGFGAPATEKLIQLGESASKKVADYGRIVGGSKTAETKAADEALDGALGTVPHLNNHSLIGATAEIAHSVMRKLIERTNGAKGTAARAAIAKVATMDRGQLVSLLKELDRSKSVKALNSVLKSAVVNANVQAGAPGR